MASSWKRKTGRGLWGRRRGEKWENISSSNSFALIWIPSEMSGEVGQWDFQKFVLYFFFLSPSLLILSCHWKMSNAIRSGGDDELERESEWKRATERERKTEDWLSGGLGLSWVPYQLTERPRQWKRERGREEIDLYLCSRGREWLMSLHLDIEATI